MTFQKYFGSIGIGAAIAAFTTLTSNPAQAAQFFDFKITFADNTIGSGSFSVSETPNHFEIYKDISPIFGSYIYTYRQWNSFGGGLSNATYTYQGQTYTPSGAYFSFYEFPNTNTNHYVDTFGSSLKNLSLYYGNDPSYSTDELYVFDAAKDTEDAVYINHIQYPYSISITARITAPQSVPEPATITGLALAGAGLLATRRKQQAAATKVLEKISA